MGHTFGVRCSVITEHDGRGRLDGLALTQWQNRYCSHWRRPWMHPSGRFDGLTQRAVLEVQRRLGQPPTGILGPVEWAAVWELDPPPPRKPPERKPAPKLTKGQRRKAKEARQRYWQQFSEFRVELGRTPDAPAWYPGRVFGPHEQGDHVQCIQEILGFNPTGRFQVGMAQRVAGLQKLHGLAVSGVVDAATARLLESMRQTE